MLAMREEAWRVERDELHMQLAEKKKELESLHARLAAHSAALAFSNNKISQCSSSKEKPATSTSPSPFANIFKMNIKAIDGSLNTINKEVKKTFNISELEIEDRMNLEENDSVNRGSFIRHEKSDIDIGTNLDPGYNYNRNLPTSTFNRKNLTDTFNQIKDLVNNEETGGSVYGNNNFFSGKNIFSNFSNLVINSDSFVADQSEKNNLNNNLVNNNLHNQHNQHNHFLKPKCNLNIDNLREK
jgi:hypothetical protein